VQLSLVRVIQGFENFCGTSSAELRGWLKAIVTNEVHRMRRSFDTEKRDLHRETALPGFDDDHWALAPVDGQLTPSSQSIARERIEKFYAILEQLSAEHAEVIRLRNIERCSFREIAEKMVRSPEAAAKLWYRAMIKFEEELRADGNFGSS
jgi:RNA polymerase sigma-70 factor (ECF subfamily)